MAEDREIALEQALVAVIAAAKDMGVDTSELVSEAQSGLIGGKGYRWVEHPYVSMAIEELADAKANGESMRA